jgi:hypothetical protein
LTIFAAQRPHPNPPKGEWLEKILFVSAPLLSWEKGKGDEVKEGD